MSCVCGANCCFFLFVEQATVEIIPRIHEKDSMILAT